MEFDVDGGGGWGWGWGRGVGGGVLDGLGEYCVLGGSAQRGPESFSSISFDAGLRKQAPVWDRT